jgi:hypothetical protein
MLKIYCEAVEIHCTKCDKYFYENKEGDFDLRKITCPWCGEKGGDKT